MNTKQQILNIIKETSKIKSKLLEKDIILLTNTRNLTKNIGDLEIQFAKETEFFKEEEFEEIEEGLKDEGYYVKSYFNEIAFIKDVLFGELKPQNIVVYNLARNGNKEGKKALIPSFCDLLNIPYTGSNAFAISLCRNKYIYSKVLETNNIPTPKCWLYLGRGIWASDKPSVGEKVIAKPVFESSSIGLDKSNIFQYIAGTDYYIEELFAKNNNNPLIIQRFISGYECEVPFFRYKEPQILEPIGIAINNTKLLDNIILTEELSDSDTYTFYPLQDLLPKEKIEKISEYCYNAAKILGIENYGRIDFRIDKNFNVFITDIAASPFTTKHSSIAYIFEKYNIPYSTIFTLILSCKFLR